jgi:hypothetical protein
MFRLAWPVAGALHLPAGPSLVLPILTQACRTSCTIRAACQWEQLCCACTPCACVQAARLHARPRLHTASGCLQVQLECPAFILPKGFC